MVKTALGLIETIGLAAAVEAADTAVKAANIKLIGYELTKGGGMVTVKLCGDVGAVQAAVQAGAQAAAKVNKVWAVHVIPRPHNELEKLIQTRETTGCASEPPPAAPEFVPVQREEKVEPAPVPAVTAEELPPDDKAPAAVPGKKAPEVCNLCGDPACSRRKGEPRTTCIHYETNKEEE